MDRALNLGLLAGALDGTANLPTPDELRSMLADAEVAAFFRQTDRIDLQLLETAWNLHHVGTARPVLQLYEPVRQVQANSVAAHILFTSTGVVYEGAWPRRGDGLRVRHSR